MQFDAVVVRVSGVVRERVVIARRIQLDAPVVRVSGIVCNRVVARIVQADAESVVRCNVVRNRVAA